MIENRIYNLTSSQFKSLDRKDNEGCYTVEFNGKSIQDQQSLFRTIKERFELPDASNWDGIVDWMTDLSWVDSSCICLVVNNYSQFLKDDKKTKKLFLEIFDEDILKFWEKEVLTTIVGRKTKKVNLYLID